MSTYTELTYQVVFGSKYRNNFLPEDHQDELFTYLGKRLENLRCFPIIQGGHLDHLHLLFSAPPSLSLSKIVQEVKKSAHNFIERNCDIFPGFTEWQVGYGGFSYRKSDRPYLIKYIQNQKQHHAKETFKEELIRLLVEHEIEFEEQYLFV